ncbi:pilus assembly protein PilM [Patescibacteria group bacterium]|nr:pilus assembly protein PilM [Patescibacteria group bacterium]
MFRDIFKIRSRKFLGVDIGTSSIKIVELGRRGQNRKLENYGEAEASSFKERPFRVFKKNTLSLSNREVAETIRAICKEAGIQTKEVSFSLPDFCSFFTSFRLPAMSKEELPEAVKYEVRPYIPLPLSEITLDWLITEGESSKTPLKILVVAIPNEIIVQYQEIAHLSDLKLRTLEPEVFALGRSSVKNKNGEKIVGLVDIGARSTTCSILERGIFKTSHSFNIAGNELTEAIARSLNIDYNKAGELRRKYGLLSDNVTSEEFQKNIREILVPLVDSILEEIRKIFRNFYQVEGKEVEKIILAGGLGLTPGLKEYFSAQLKKEISIADPFLHISYPAILADTLKEIGPTYAVAVGAALKGLE